MLEVDAVKRREDEYMDPAVNDDTASVNNENREEATDDNQQSPNAAHTNHDEHAALIGPPLVLRD